MSSPLTSVVIPTSGRPQYLPQAVRSALSGMGEDIEVIVVPNGQDESWIESLEPFHGDARVRVFPIETAGANSARNHGASLARGKYIRFLDDDDLLYTGGVRHQVELLERTGADIASSPIELLRDDGRSFARLKPSSDRDFVAAAMGSKRLLQVTAHLFKRQVVEKVRWDDSLTFGQDIDWMFRLCEACDPAWVTSEVTCGGWRRHTGQRLSVNTGVHRVKQLMANGILRLVSTLESEGRMTPERRAGAASGLWDAVHSALFFSPAYWSTVAAAAERIQPGSHPDTKFFTYRVSRSTGLTPLQWEKLLMPKRMMGYSFKRAMLAIGIARTW